MLILSAVNGSCRQHRISNAAFIIHESEPYGNTVNTRFSIRRFLIFLVTWQSAHIARSCCFCPFYFRFAAGHYGSQNTNSLTISMCRSKFRGWKPWHLSIYINKFIYCQQRHAITVSLTIAVNKRFIPTNRKLKK